MNLNDVRRIINEEIIINEIFDRQLETEFTQTSKIINEYETIVYNFKTNSGVEYSLLFMFDELTEPNIFKYLKYESNEIKLIHIAFTLSDRLNTVDLIDFNDNTNNNETIELLSRISYLCNYFIDKHSDIFLYVVGNEHETNKLIIYNRIFENIFSNKFKKVNIYLDEYNSNVMVFIRKNMLK